MRLTLLGALAIDGCILPISVDETGAPPLVVAAYHSDGSPIAGRSVSVSDESWDDGACLHPKAVARSDDAGRVFLPRVILHRRGILIIPPVEHFFNPYVLCTGPSDSTMRVAFKGITGLPTDTPGDTLTCIDWDWEARTRTTCARTGTYARRLDTQDMQHVFPSGGVWHEGDDTGWYRIIVDNDTRSKPPYRRAVTFPAAYLQWIAEPSGIVQRRVRATIELPSDLSNNSPIVAELAQRGGRWHAIVRGSRLGGWGERDVTYVFALGAPGQVATVVDGQ